VISHDNLRDTAARGGAPASKAQTLLGHRPIDTTLRYAPLYDGPLAADHYQVMAEIESRFEGGEDATSPPDSGQLLALVDALHAGTLNNAQRETAQALRTGILALAENGNGSRA
jgi:hypothetical protein